MSEKRMNMNIQEAAKEYADGLYEPTDRGILYRETQDDFTAGAEWERQKAIEAFKFATDGYFIIGGTDYSANRLSEFIEKLNS